MLSKAVKFSGKDTRSSLDEVGEFIDPLTPAEIASIYEFYKMDFELMGYAKLDNPKFPYIDLDS